jgi:VIT1/CCC1 family predicted Fe2+/Mn2+ transporter
MSDRTVERTRDAEADTAGSTDTASTDPRADTASGSAAETTEETGGSYFSLQALVVAFVAIGAGMTLGSLVPMIPFTAFAGIPVGAFLHGLLDSERRYAETAVAGGLLSGLAVATSLLPMLLAGLDGTRLFAIASSVGIVLALLGHYFGRDLRNGLTRDL